MGKKTVIISDQHIGSYGAQEQKVVDFLTGLEADLLVFNGDLYDVFLLKNNPSNLIFSTLQYKSKVKTWIYLRGNHDEGIEKLFPLLQYRIHDSLEILSGRGVVTHGHQFDPLIKNFGWKWFVMAQNFVERKLKVNIQEALHDRFSCITKRALAPVTEAAMKKYTDKEVIILGHTHIPGVTSGGVYNCGAQCDGLFTWIEILEDESGGYKIEIKGLKQ